MMTPRIFPSFSFLSASQVGMFGAILAGLLLLSCTSSSDGDPSQTVSPDTTLPAAVADTSTFAAGCFWCAEAAFDEVEGVAATTSGFAGGEVANPSYDQVSRGRTDHTEVVQVIYDSSQVDYERLLRVYWHNVDPFDGEGQFCDRGSQYRPAIFTRDARQHRLAEQSMETVMTLFDRPIAVEIEPLDAFYPAEEYHQDYHQKNPQHYKSYVQGCGRYDRLEEVWGERARSAAPLTAE